jgi:sterol desaturase/sphingolipid hydroxylase (fatty acid hydroxylase superfamily)
VQWVYALIIGEFFLYWVHRLAHEWDILWRFHAVHHSAPRLYFLNATRFHPVDLAISNFAPFVPLMALGATAEVMALFSVTSAVHGFFQHANLPMKLGPLNYFFSMAELHRWHHSPILEEANANYGQNLIVWDIVFGTRFLPKDREPPAKIGITGMPNFPMRYWGQLMSPFNWAKLNSENSESSGQTGV